MTILNLQVGASSDDGYQYWDGSDWVWTITHGYQNAGYWGATALKYGGGMRFLNATIPAGSTINAAYLTLRCQTSKSTTGVKTKIRGEDADNPGTLSTQADYAGRTRTTAEVLWDNIASWTADTDYNSPEIKTVIQEIVDRGGWASGNAMVIFWDDHDDRSDHNAETIRQAYAYDNSSTYAPKLHIEYTSVTEKTSSDSGSGAEALGSRIFAAAEAGSGTGVSSLLAALIGTGESGLGSEFATKIFSVFDAGSGVDAVIARLLAAVEAGAGAEAALFIAALSSGDVGTGADLATLLKNFLAGDEGRGIEALKALIEISGPDMKLRARPGQVRIPFKGVNL